MAFKPISDLSLGKTLQPFQQKGVKLQLATLRGRGLDELKKKKPDLGKAVSS
jgi:hypothetical protein